MDQLIQKLDQVFVGKAPALPENAKEWLVKFGPWITLVIIILFLPVILFALGLSAVFAPFAAAVDGNAVRGLAFAWIFLAVSLGLEIAALPGLFNRRMQGWRLLFYGILFNAIYSLFNLDWFNLIIGSGISLYLVMQIRTKYA